MSDPVHTTILLVDDSRLLRVANERALHKAGYSVICAADGEAALVMTREQMPDLILLDMMLPKVEGLEVLRTLKGDSRTADIPVIVLTGLGQQNAAKLMNEGAAAYFVKSDSLLHNNSETLLHVIETVLSRRQSHAALVGAPLVS